ncbi:MAG: glycosyltransferase family 2 protein [Gemmatimonadaceae bacterium]|nr:glycosyltransferase family 2 protein [Chitinophagaceae bacterium]
MVQLSVVIITFNEEQQIRRCIESVSSFADEIVILDSHSTDRTTEIAGSLGAIVYSAPFAGYIEQKNKALSLATHPHVLCLDADEAVDDTLRTSILTVKSDFAKNGYTMNRCTNYCGQFIRHGSWYPDRKLRLFDKRKASWGGDNPHDKVYLQEGEAGHLPGDILHYSYNSIEEHVTQNNKFSTISANALLNRGKRTNIFKVLFNPCWAFVNSYIIRLGFLDGFYGFIIAANIAHLTLLKHSKLFQKQKRQLHREPNYVATTVK